MTKKFKVILCCVLGTCVLVGLLFIFGRNQAKFIDTFSNETYTTLYKWFWEDQLDYAVYVQHDDIMTTGYKKIKQGVGIFSPTEYEMEFGESKFEVHYVISEDWVEEVEYKWSKTNETALTMNFDTEKQIIGWTFTPDDTSDGVYTSLPAGTSGTLHLYPVYAD